MSDTKVLFSGSHQQQKTGTLPCILNIIVKTVCEDMSHTLNT